MEISEDAVGQLKVLENQFAQNAETRKSIAIVCGAGITLASISDSKKLQSFSWHGAIKDALLEANKLTKIAPDEKKKIEEALEKIKQGEMDSLDAQQLTEFAKLAKQILVSKNRYSSWLISKFDTGLVPEPNNRDLLDAIVECSKLDKVNTATTNYDYLISKAQGWNGEADGAFTPINWKNDRSFTTNWLNQTSKRVLHLHGDARNPESVIFSSDDYNRLNSDDWVRRIRNVFNNNIVCIFIGCGETLKDEAFTKLLNEYGAGLNDSRFASRWFQVVMNGEGLAHSDLLPLDYGSKYSDLAPYIQKYLVPILSGNKYKKIEFSSTVIEKDETDLLKKLINKKFSDLSSDNQKFLIKGLIDKTDESSLTENNWYGLDCYYRISIIKWFWEKLNKHNNNDDDINFKEILMLLTLQACVKIITFDELNDVVLEIADFIKQETSVEKRDLSVATLVHAKHGYGCEIEGRDDTWGVKNQLFTSKLQPIEADGSGSEYLTSVKNEINGIINLNKASNDPKQIIKDINVYKEKNLAQLYLVDDDRKLTKNTKEQLGPLGIKILEISKNTDKNLFNFLKEISKNYSNLTNMKRKEKEDGLNANINISNSTITNSQIGRGNIKITPEIEKLPENENKSWLNIFKNFFRGKNVKNNSK